MKKFFLEDFSSPLEDFFEDFIVDVRNSFSKTFNEFKKIALLETPSSPSFKYHGNSLRISLPLPSGCTEQDLHIQFTRDGYFKVSGNYRSHLEGAVSHATPSRHAAREQYEGYFVKSFYIGEGVEYLGAHIEQGVLYCDFKLRSGVRLTHPSSFAALGETTVNAPRLREGSYPPALKANKTLAGRNNYFLEASSPSISTRNRRSPRALPAPKPKLLEAPRSYNNAPSLNTHTPYENTLGVNRASRFFRNNKERQRL